MKPAAVRRPAIGVHGHRRIGMRVVADPRPLVDARADPGVVRPGQHDRGTAFTQDRGGPDGDVKGEGVFRVSGVGLGTRGVALLVDAARVHLACDHRGGRRVPTVVPGVQQDRASPQGALPRRRQPRGGGIRPLPSHEPGQTGQTG